MIVERIERTNALILFAVMAAGANTGLVALSAWALHPSPWLLVVAVGALSGAAVIAGARVALLVRSVRATVEHVRAQRAA